MFKDAEVMSIRSLADTARRERVPQSQLQTLVQAALGSRLEELRMEIDVRQKEGKIGNAFPGLLKQELERLKGENLRDREKRSVLIKYIAKLSR